MRFMAWTPYTAGNGWYRMRSIMASKYSRTTSILSGHNPPLPGFWSPAASVLSAVGAQNGPTRFPRFCPTRCFELFRLLDDIRGTGAAMKISARNPLKWAVTQVTKGVTTSHVKIDIGGAVITTSITNEAIDELKLAKGQTAYAIIKASDVMVAV